MRKERDNSEAWRSKRRRREGGKERESEREACV